MLRELDAARAETRADDAGAARVRRRRLARAAHAADQHPRQPGAARRPSFADRDADAEEERDRRLGALAPRGGCGRLVADLLLLARADAGRTGAAPQLRPRRDRRAPRSPRCGRSPTATRSQLDDDRARRRSRATPTSCTGWSSTCSTTASATRPPAATDRGRGRRRARRRRGARGLRRRARAPRRASASRSSRASSAAAAPPTSPPDSGTGLGLAIVKAVADVPWRQGRGRQLALGRGRVPRPPAPRGAGEAAGAESLATLYGGVIPCFLDETRPVKANPRRALAGHPLASSESEPIRPAGGSPP